MVSTSFMVDTSSHPRAQLHRCVERSAYAPTSMAAAFACTNGIFRPCLDFDLLGFISSSSC